MQVSSTELLAICDEVNVVRKGVVNGVKAFVFGLGFEDVADVFNGPLVDGGQHFV